MKLVHVATIESKYGDPEAFGERELQEKVDLSKFSYGTKVFAVTTGWVFDDFKKLMEERLKFYTDQSNIPFGMIPGSPEAVFYMNSKAESYRDVLEMMPTEA